MIKFDNVDVYNFDGAIRGIRNSWDSHEKSDSGWQRELVEIGEYYAETKENYVIGVNDLKLAKNLVKAGASHAKFMRQILISVDITAPLYWWKQFDQYKVGTTTNSESTMHTINRTGFYKDNELDENLFSIDYPFVDCLSVGEIDAFGKFFNLLENLRIDYNKTKDKRYWDLLIALLPSGFNQMRTTTMNYSVLANIYHDRKNHKLKEWHEMCDWIETLPYSELITGGV